MNAEEHHKMAAVEDAMWYYRTLHGIVNDELAAALGAGAVAPAVLDAGCGTGGLLRRLAEQQAAWKLTGVDLSAVACELARTRADKARIVEGSIESLPFENGSFDAVVSCDVVCQVGAPERAVGEIARCLRPGGVALLTFPAYAWLYSYHDRQVGNLRRYSRREAAALIRGAGLSVERNSHWNALLLPLAVVQRKLLGGDNAPSDVKMFPAPVEACFNAIMRGERGWLRRGGTWPFGCALFVVARKTG